jgi:regulator of RNase E activity RraA
MYRLIQPGDVVVLQAGDQSVAHAGDITSLIYQKLGAQGFITDGLIRDGRRIRDLDFPCFCKGANPIDALGYWAITNYNKPISMPGLRKDVIVFPGDYIYADSDGVILIPRERHEEFESVVIENFDREEACRERFLKIQSPGEVYQAVREVFEKHGRW